jgi:hypothetical protein
MPPAPQQPLTPLPPAGWMPPGPEPWRGYVERLAPEFGNPPVPFVMQWIAMESDGLPSAIGWPGDLDAAGNVKESGLFQLMSPHDIALAGTTVAQMRSCCEGQTNFPGLARQPPNKDKQSPEYKAWYAAVAAARAQAQSLARPLSEDQRVQQIRAGLAYIANVAKLVDASFARYGAAWSHGTNDFWSMVKAYHAGSGIPTMGLDAAVAALGHVPASWQEFKQGIWASPLGHSLDNLLSNAERCGVHAFPRAAGV